MSNLLDCWHVDIFKYVVFSHQIKILTNNDSHINYFIPAKTEEKKTTDKQTDFGKSRTQKAQTHFFWATQICQQKTQKTRQMSRQTGSRFGFLGHPIWNGKGWFCQKKQARTFGMEWLKKIPPCCAMVWRGWPSVFQDSVKNMADEIAKWLFAISWQPSDTQRVPAHLATTPGERLVLILAGSLFYGTVTFQKKTRVLKYW